MTRKELRLICYTAIAIIMGIFGQYCMVGLLVANNLMELQYQ